MDQQQEEKTWATNSGEIQVVDREKHTKKNGHAAVFQKI